ncbi:MAG TPA: hypothetical protein VL133_00810 [Devosia sp.]|nr:hypothetical protein [Devosia sp.]
MRLIEFIRAAFIVTAFAAGGMAVPAMAQDANTRVVIPDVPGGALLAGCYRITQRIYGPYRMDFCLEQRGTYAVTGGNIRCNGRLDWAARGRDVSINLRRTSCGNGVAWSADRMTCRGTGLFAGILARIFTPGLPVLGGLRCTYTPVAGNQRPITIIARRIN